MAWAASWKQLARNRSVATFASEANEAGDLGRFLKTLGEDDSDLRRARQATTEARRLSRRSVYRTQDPADSLNSASACPLDIPESLRIGINRLEQAASCSSSCSSESTKIYESLLRQCAATKAISEGKRLHELMLRTEMMNSTFLGNLLIQMYGSCGDPQEALGIFRSLKRPNIFSWNIMITAYAQNGYLQEARQMFDQMPNKKNVVTWNTMIAAYAQRGHSQEALDLFEAMDEEPSTFTFIHVLQACESLGALDKARQIHSAIFEHGWESDLILSTALFNVYAKHGKLQEARTIFDRMKQRDVVAYNAMVAAYVQKGHMEEAMKLFMSMPVRNASSWNTMISAYVQSGHSKAALGLFKVMDLEGVQPSKITFLVVLGACCTGESSLPDGKIIHSELVEAGFVVDATAGTALISMYGKCGSPETASTIFARMSQQNAIAWAALVTAYAHNGRAPEAAELFRLMCQEGFTPNQLAFLNVLHGCSHGGLLKSARSFFQSMIGDFGLEPILEHYICMVDVLSRSGRIESAENLISDMPLEPDTTPWMVLLAACNTHHDVERGENAARQILTLDPAKGGVYSLLANLYTISEDQKGIRSRKYNRIRRTCAHEFDEFERLDFTCGKAEQDQENRSQ